MISFIMAIMIIYCDSALNDVILSVLRFKVVFPLDHFCLRGSHEDLPGLLAHLENIRNYFHPVWLSRDACVAQIKEVIIEDYSSQYSTPWEEVYTRRQDTMLAYYENSKESLAF